MINWKQKLKDMTAEKRDYALTNLVESTLVSRKRDRIKELLLNIHYLEAKTEAGKVFELADDFAGTVPVLQENSLKLFTLIEEALQRDIHFIYNHPTTLFQCLWNSCWWYDSPQLQEHLKGGNSLPENTDEKLYLLLESWKAEKEKSGSFIWLKALRPHSYPLAGSLKTRFNNHTGAIKYISLAPDCATAMTYSYDQTVKLWDINSGRQIASLDLPDSQVSFFGYNLQGKPCLLHQNPDERLVFTDIQSSKDIQYPSIDAETKIIGCSEYMNLYLCLSRDNRLFILNSCDSRIIAERNYTEGKVQKANLSEKSSKVCLVTENLVFVWDYLSGHFESIPNDVFTNITFTRDCRFAAWGGLGRIKVYDIYQKSIVNELGVDPSSGIRSLALSSDGTLVASGYDNGRIDLWDIHNAEKVNSYRDHSYRIECLIFSDDNKLLLSGSEDTTACLWRTESYSPDYEIQGHTEQIKQVEILSQGQWIVTASYDKTVKIWNTDNGKLVKEIDCRQTVERIVINEVQNRLFIGLSHEVLIWNLNTLQQITVIKSPGRIISIFSVSRDGTQMALAAKDLHIRLFSVMDGTEQAVLKGHKCFIQGLDISPNGKLLASGSADGTLRIWDIAKAREIARIKSKERWDLALPLVQFISNREIVLLWESDLLRIWDIEDMREITCLHTVSSEIATFGVSDSGKYILCMTTDHHITVWRTVDYKIVTRHKGFIGNDFDLFVFGDGREKFFYTPQVNRQDCTLLFANSKAIAWCPHRFLSVLPSGNQWASWQGDHFTLFSLEGYKDMDKSINKQKWQDLSLHVAATSKKKYFQKLQMKKTKWWRRLLR